MNIQQANRILDEHKERQCHSMLTVTRALWITGDLSTMDEPLPETCQESRLESTYLVDSEGLGC
jgi:hypothetical protein